MLKRIWREDEGVLTFEWILLITLLVIGITGALSAVRDAIAAELIDVAGAIVNIDTSYSICAPVQGGAGITTSCASVGCCFGGGNGSVYSRPVPSFGARRTNGTTPVPATCCS